MTAERGKVMQPQQISGSSRHCIYVQFAPPRRDEPRFLRVDTVRGNGNSIDVVAAQRRESSVESCGRTSDIAHADVVRQESGQAPDQRQELRLTNTDVTWIGILQGVRGDIHMCHLTGGMHAAVGTAGPKEAHRHAEHRG